MGWSVLSVNTHVGVGDVEQIGCALTLNISSPNGQRLVDYKIHNHLHIVSIYKVSQT